MKCTNCGKESQWLEILGSDFICKKCIMKNKVMAAVFRTHMDTFRYIIRKLKIGSYSEFMKITRKDAERVADLKKQGIFLKTTNVVEM